MNTELLSYPSSDGKNIISATFYLPDDGITPRGVVQLSHGMTDYVGRYTYLAKYLTDRGYVVCGNDHLGHGNSVACTDDLGFFAEKDGVGYVLDDLHAMTGLAKARYPELPFFLVGHSMGSFLCRLYASRFGYEPDGLVILGTGGPNPLLPLGRALARLIRRFHGSRYRSSLLANMAFSGYNSRYEKGEPKTAWVTRDKKVLAAYNKDPFSHFTFTVSAYLDLFSMVHDCNTDEWFSEFPKNLRTLVASGSMDPVGAFGEGPAYVADKLKEAGVKDVTMFLYDGARHELFNELNRDQFFADLTAWLDATGKKV